ncbi:MAG: hypothetical protein IPK75_01455 [Acidobacteria bacterium]|nr:hypothetical protein [Acidobacteriota bacterium]
MGERSKDGGPAFPTAGSTGMSLRDWFAGQALAGLCGTDARVYIDRNKIAGRFASVAFELADAMIAAREAANG